MPADPKASTSSVLTLPNLVSFVRIAAIPGVVWAILHEGTEGAGLIGFALLAATDWLDGFLARRMDSVTELGKVLDPVADRLATVSVLVALVIRDAFPIWAAALVAIRDIGILVAGAVLLAGRRVRIDVRRIGKLATLALMLAVPSIAWGRFGLWLAPVASAVGWAAFAVGIVTSYAAAAVYATDVRRALARRASPG